MLFGPIALFFMAECFLLPVQSFTFRQWEALMSENGNNIQYAFFPNAQIAMWEYGDQFRYRTRIPPRLTRWFTDSMGYRNREHYHMGDKYCFVAIGDSNVIGSSLDQSEMLSEVLQRKSACLAYNAAAPNATQRFFAREEFRANPPQFVVLQSIAGHFYSDHAFAMFDSSGKVTGAKPEPGLIYRVPAFFYRHFLPDSLRVSPWVIEDIARRNAAWQYFRARSGMTDLPLPPSTNRYNVYRNISPEQSARSTRNAGVYGADLYRTASKAQAEATCPVTIKQLNNEMARSANCRMINIVRTIAEVLRSWGSELILYMQPAPDEYLDPGFELLEAEGYKIVRFPPSKKLPYGIDFDWYWATDDSHWQPRAVDLAGDLIIAVSKGQSAETMLPALHEVIEREMHQLMRR